MENTTNKNTVDVVAPAPEAEVPAANSEMSEQAQVVVNKEESAPQEASAHEEHVHANKDKEVSAASGNSLRVSEKSETKSGFEERVIGIKRISKTTKGGRVMRFSALVVIGDKNGTVGFGMGKSNEVPDAIKKAIKNANNNLYTIKMNKRGTLYHEVYGRHGAAKVMLKPAAQGRGIIAGGSVRAVVELLGFKDISAKSMGSTTPINVIRATIDGLTKQFSPSDVAKARDKNIRTL